MQTLFQTVVKAMQINRLMNNLSCESFAFFRDFNAYLGLTAHHFRLIRTRNARKVLWSALNIAGTVLNECQIGPNYRLVFHPSINGQKQHIYLLAFIPVVHQLHFPPLYFLWQLLQMPIHKHLRLTTSNQVQIYVLFSHSPLAFFCLRFSRPDANCITDAKISWSIFDSSVYIIWWFYMLTVVKSQK